MLIYMMINYFSSNWTNVIYFVHNSSMNTLFLHWFNNWIIKRLYAMTKANKFL